MAGGFFSLVISSILFLIVTGFVWVEIRVLREWKRWWRGLALLPALALIGVILNILISVAKTRSAHNLWPFEIVLWSGGGLVFLGILSLVKKTHIFKDQL